MEDKTKIPIVETEWNKSVEYYFYFDCPNCDKLLEDYNFNINECDKVNRQFKCPYCKQKFKLKVKSL